MLPCGRVGKGGRIGVAARAGSANCFRNPLNRSGGVEAALRISDALLASTCGRGTRGAKVELDPTSDGALEFWKVVMISDSLQTGLPMDTDRAVMLGTGDGVSAAAGDDASIAGGDASTAGDGTGESKYEAVLRNVPTTGLMTRCRPLDPSPVDCANALDNWAAVWSGVRGASCSIVGWTRAPITSLSAFA
jgi:hypothetical protein